jgi:hypothetical protein
VACGPWIHTIATTHYFEQRSLACSGQRLQARAAPDNAPQSPASRRALAIGRRQHNRVAIRIFDPHLTVVRSRIAVDIEHNRCL